MADDENVIGAATVKVVADLTEYNAGLATARTQAGAFGRDAEQAMRGAVGATESLTRAERQLLDGLKANGLTVKEVNAALNGNAQAKRLAAVYAREFEAAQRAEAAATGALTSAQDAATASASQRLVVDKASAEQFRVRAAMTKQMFGDETTAASAAASDQARIAASTLAFRVRMARQQAGEELAVRKATAAEVKQAEAAAEAQAVQGFNLRRRLTTQQAAEAEAMEKRRRAVLSASDPLVGAAIKRDAAVGEAGALLGAGVISEAEHAKALSAAEGAYRRVEEAAGKAAKGVNAVGTAFGSSRAVTESAAMVSEVLSGRFNRLAGSATVLARYSGFLPAILSPVGLSIAAVAATTIAATAATIAYANAQEHLANVAAGAGRRSGLSRTDLNAASGQAAGASGQSEIGTRAVVEAMAAAGVQSRATVASIGELAAVYDRLTGQKPEKGTEELAKAMGLLYDGTKGANEAVNIFQKRLGDVTEGQRAQIIAAVRMNDVQRAQNILWGAVAPDLIAARDAGNGAATVWDKLASAALKAWDGTGKLGNASAKTSAAMAYADGATGLAARYMALGRAAHGAADAIRDANTAAAQQRTRLIDAQGAAQGAHLQTPEGREGESFDDLVGRRAKSLAGWDASRKLGDTAAAATYLHDYQAEDDAIRRVTDAHGNYIRALDREHQVHQLEVQEIQARKGHRADEVKALAERIALLKTGDTVETNADARRAAADAGDIAGARATPGAGRHNVYAESMAQKGLDAKDQLELANGYLQSAEAAAKAEAAVKGLSRAEREHLTVAQRTAMVQAQLDLDAAQAAAEVAKKASTLDTENAAQQAANRAVAAGEMGRKEAERHAKIEIELAPLRAAAALGTAAAKNALAAAIERLTAAEARQDSTGDDTEAVDMIDKQRKAQALAVLKTSLVGKPKVEAARQEAELTASQTLGVSATKPATALQQQAITGAGEAGAAEETERLAKAQDDLSRSVSGEIEKLRAQTAVIGMGREAAAEYTKFQELLTEAKKAGIAVDDQEIAKLHALSAAYGQASEAAQKAAEAQKATLEASKSLADSFEGAIEGAIFDHKKFAQSAHDLAVGIDKDFLKAALSGSGPFAGMMGTEGDASRGGAHGGVLGQLFGTALGVKGAGTNMGQAFSRGDTPANPLFVAMAGAAGGPSGSMLAGLFGGGGGAGASMGTTGADGSDLSAMAGLFHTGTSYVGTPGRQIPVSPKLFVGAPRLHSGLAPDEFPAILQRGERVTAKNGARVGGGVVINQTIHASDAGSFRRTSGQIQREMSRGMRRGG